jgi:adenine nucleotide transporter 17
LFITETLERIEFLDEPPSLEHAHPMDPSSDPAVEATAGAIGSLITCVAIMPVDTAKVRIQAGVSTDGVLGTMQAVVKSEGLRALYRGLWTKALHTMLQNWLYFFTYEWLKARRKSLGLRTSTLVNTACGVLAGVSNLTVTLPLETLMVRLQTGDASKNLSQHASELVAGGPSSVWCGFGVSSVLTLNPALTMAIFDALKARVSKLTKRARLSTLEGFLVGSLAKAIATIITYPLIRTKVVMQLSSGQGNGHPPKGMAETFVNIWRREGAEGLFRGCSAQIFTAVSKSGIQLAGKEQLAGFALLILMRAPPAPHKTCHK